MISRKVSTFFNHTLSPSPFIRIQKSSLYFDVLKGPGIIIQKNTANGARTSVSALGKKNKATDLLIHQDIDPNALIPDKGFIPFHLIIGNQCETFAFKITKIFLRCGGDPNLPSIDVTPTHVAAEWGKTRILHLLLVNGGDPWIQDDEKKTAFSFTFEEQAWDAIDMLHQFQQIHSASKRDDVKPKFHIDSERVLLHRGEEMSEKKSAKSTTTKTSDFFDFSEFSDFSQHSPLQIQQTVQELFNSQCCRSLFFGRSTTIATQKSQIFCTKVESKYQRKDKVMGFDNKWIRLPLSGIMFKRFVHNTPLLKRATEIKGLTERYNLTSSDFTKQVNTIYYVDKTLFIRSALEVDGFQMISAPRRFFKSTNLSMLKAFLEIQCDENLTPFELKVDKNGNIMEEQNNGNFKYFIGTQILEDKEFFVQNFGRYPVLFLDFNLLGGSSKDEVSSNCLEMLENILLEHKRFLTHSKVKLSSKEIFESDLMKLQKRGNIATCFTCLRDLTKILYECFGREVYLIIDEYDSALHRAIFLKDNDEVEKIFQFMMDFLVRNFKGNPYVGGGMFAGCTHILSREFNVVKYYPFLSGKYFKYNGFTEQETTDLFKKLNRNEEDVRFVLDSYGGYLAPKSQVTIVNPWSTLNFLDRGEISFSYWTPAIPEDIVIGLLNFPKIAEIFEKLVYGEKVYIVRRPSVSLFDVQKLSYLSSWPKNDKNDSSVSLSDVLKLSYLSSWLKNDKNDSSVSLSDVLKLRYLSSWLKDKKVEKVEEVTNLDTDLCLQYLWENGYLVGKKVSENDRYMLWIPNKEIKSHFQNYLFKFDILKLVYGWKENAIAKFKNACLKLDENPEVNENVEEFLRSLYSLVDISTSEFDFHRQVMNALMAMENSTSMGLTISIAKIHWVKEFLVGTTASKKPDVCLFIKKSLIVIELKYGKRESEESALKAALERGYHTLIEVDTNFKDFETKPTNQITIGLHLLNREMNLSYLLRKDLQDFEDKFSYETLKKMLVLRKKLKR